MTSTNDVKKVALRSSDGEVFEVDEAAAKQCKIISSMIETDCIVGVIPLPNVNAEILSKVLEYCVKHAAAGVDVSATTESTIVIAGPDWVGNADDSATAAASSTAAAATTDEAHPTVPTEEEELKAWDAEYVKVDVNTLYHLLLAANYLNIKSLLDLLSQTVAGIIRGKKPEEIRKHFGIVNDFSPEEEEEVRRENQWAFD